MLKHTMKSTKRQEKYKRVTAAICAVLIAILQVFVIVPVFAPESSEAYGASPGGDLVVRVQYIGERGDKVREKAVFSSSQLASMGSGTYYYSNITSVGGIMRMVATGPKITTILSSAGIDLGSIHHINFRTSDGGGAHQRYSMNFTSSHYASSNRWYYPYLMKHYKRNSDGTITPLSAEGLEETDPTEPTDETETTAPTEPSDPTNPGGSGGGDSGGDGGGESPPPEAPLTSDTGVTVYMFADGDSGESNAGSGESSGEGALTGAVRVPAILAIRSYSTKVNSNSLSTSMMSKADSYRFCLGQTPLRENVKTSASDVSSYDSAKYIFGIDVILYGSPSITGLNLSADGTDAKVGSKKQIHAIFEGDAAGFSEKDLTWSTGDISVATVSDSGMVSIKKKGPVTITARTADGISASITLNGTGSGETGSGGAGQNGDQDSAGGSDSDRVEKPEDANESKEADIPAETLTAKVITIGDEVVTDPSPMTQGRAAMASDAEALSAAEEYNPGTVAVAAVVAAGAFVASGVLRIRRFRRDI